MNALHGLYVITDAALCARHGLSDSVAAALRGGARLVQYRDKSGDQERRLREAKALAALCREHGATFIINDDVMLAKACDAHGVHLGRDDGDIAAAREALGTGKVIGISCYDELERARRVRELGADYIAFGSLFPSSIKPDAVRAPLTLFAEARHLGLPMCGIGGIDRDNIADVAAAGADMAAVISAVFDRPSLQEIEQAARALAGAFG